MIGVVPQRMPHLKIFHVVDDHQRALTACCKVSSIVREFQGPDLAGIAIEFEKCLEWELTSVANVIGK